jgi:hypothetical protein
MEINIQQEQAATCALHNPMDSMQTALFRDTCMEISYQIAYAQWEPTKYA